jgi:hypothetical protein
VGSLTQPYRPPRPVTGIPLLYSTSYSKYYDLWAIELHARKLDIPDSKTRSPVENTNIYVHWPLAGNKMLKVNIMMLQKNVQK